MPKPSEILNLALVISELDVGGAEKNFTALACEMNKRGHQITVYSLDPPSHDPQQNRLLDLLAGSQIPVQFLNAARVRRVGGAALRLRRYLQKQRPDVIQSFLFRANLTAWLASRRIAPVSLGIRQSEPRVWARRLERYLIRRSNQTVFVSQHTANNYQMPHPVVIPNAVDTVAQPVVSQSPQSFWQKRLDSPNTRFDFVYLFVGRLVEQKNILSLTQTISRLLERNRHDHFVVVGTGPLESRMKRLLNTLPTAARIHLVGWQPDASAWIQNADLVVLNSRWEGMPNVLLEAMALGRPFVASAVDGVRELFQPIDDFSSPGSTPCRTTREQEQAREAQVARPTREEDLVERLNQLRSDPDLREFLGNWNQNWVSQHFSVQRMTDRYEHVFRKLATN